MNNTNGSSAPFLSSHVQYGLRTIFEDEDLYFDDKTTHEYAFALSGTRIVPRAIVYPTENSQITALLKLANESGIALYPLSRGRNFGYGTAQGTTDGQIIVNLNKMNQVIEVNETLGYVVLQPGVSQQQLYEYLVTTQSRLQMDITGGGKDTSIVGNVLERGFGHTEYGDRFNSILGMQVILPNGDSISTGFQDFPGAKAGHTFRHGMGPSVDGLFTQSNLGIITQMTIALQPKPDKLSMFVYLAKDDSDLEELIVNVRELSLKGIINSAVHIANDGRLEKPDRPNKAGAWNVSGSISGPGTLTKSKSKYIRRSFRKLSGKGRFFTFTEKRLRLVSWINDNIKKISVYEDLAEVMKLKKGIPTERYIKDLVRNEKASSKDLAAHEHSHAFRWISAVCPADPSEIRNMITLVSSFFQDRSYPFRVTLTFINPRSLIMITELNYVNETQAVSKAKRDYADCVALLANNGYYAYRSGPGSYDKVMPKSLPILQMLGRIKETLDPNGVLAPGKYRL